MQLRRPSSSRLEPRPPKPPARWWTLLTRTVAAWKDDKVSRHAAALSYYSALSIAPIVVVAIAVAGLVFGRDAVRAEVMAQFEGMVGTQAADTIGSMVDSAVSPRGGIIASAAGMIVLLFGSTAVFAELQQSLNAIWGVEPKPGRGVWVLLRRRVLSLSLVLAVAFLLMVSLVVSAAMSAFGHYVGELPERAILWQIVHELVSIGIFTTLFGLIYKVLPDVEIQWRDVWIGALVTALLFTLGKFLIGYYIGRAGVASHYGAAGSVVVMLVWVYYSAQIVFLGAEFTQTYAHLYGSRIVPDEDARVIPDGESGAELRPVRSGA
ncbi:MAG: YihY/virulence factor BrkB family protein [Polyangiaceae bacterium]|nr:YihY/virulence factor BrkB family protein [Polyangiaceae bacterium]